MDLRRDAGLAAAQTALAIERIAVDAGGVGTTGRIALQPGVVTAVAGEADVLVDLRHPEAEPLASMLAASLAVGERAAEARGCTFEASPIWAIEPIPFDPELVAAAEAAVAAVGGRGRAIASGALHDAAEMARRVPTAMVFAASVGGISHSKEERSTDADLTAAIEAFGRLASDPAGTPILGDIGCTG